MEYHYQTTEMKNVNQIWKSSQWPMGSMVLIMDYERVIVKYLLAIDIMRMSGEFVWDEWQSVIENKSTLVFVSLTGPK